jgi:hypothetical protein
MLRIARTAGDLTDETKGGVGVIGSDGGNSFGEAVASGGLDVSH